MIETIKTQRIVSIIDPALTHISEDKMREYGYKRDISVIEPLFDRANMPTIYHARRLPRSVWNRVVAVQPSDDLKYQAAFQYGVFRVENLSTEDGARIAFEPTGSTKTGDGEIVHVNEQEMSRFFPSDFSEIGGVIYLRSFFRPSTDVIYQVPHTLVEQWARTAVLSADANLITQAQSSEKPCSSDSQPSSETEANSASDASKSAAPTAATAEAK